MSHPTTTILVPFAFAKRLEEKRLPVQRGSANESTTTLVIFDSQVADLPLLYNALLPGSISHTIQPHQDSIDHITNLLTQTGATKLAIVAHGQPGAIQIGNGVIDRAMLEARSGLLQEWGVDSIALYSCEVGADAEFIKRFGELTGARIAASTSKIGAGNWELAGGMELLEIDRLANYSSTLTTFNGTAGADIASVNSLSISGFTGGTVADLTDSIGDIFGAGDGNDFIRAGIGNDIIYAGNGDDNIGGGNGNDRIYGGGGVNILTGGSGSDYITADDMRATVDGGLDNDFLSITSQPVVGQASKVIFTSANAGRFEINGVQTGTFTSIEQFYFIGGYENDVVDGSLASLGVTPFGTTFGYSAGLQLNGFNGNDTLVGSANADILSGDSGDDFLYGNGGFDTLVGGDGLDIIFGQADDDSIYGDAGNDTIFGGTGSDTIYGGSETDLLYGEDGNDRISGGDANDFIFGQAGDDTFNGDAGNDYLVGGSGIDTINGGIGTDEIYGEDGNDIISGNEDDDFIFGQAGNDLIYGNAGNDYLVGGNDSDTLYGGDGIDRLNGESGDDILYGEDNNDFLYGNDGFDQLYGGDGIDILDGGNNNDGLYGGLGGDVLFGGDGDDLLVGEYAYGDPAGVDYLYGGNGNDYLSGGAGADFLIGGAGSDKFVYEAMPEAGDIITDFDYTTDKISLTGLFQILGVAPSSVNANYLKFVQSGTNTLVQVDQNGTGPFYGFVTMATLNNVNSSQLFFNIGGSGNVLI
jgi:Ca2+-binding RTX toxin-like protein